MKDQFAHQYRAELTLTQPKCIVTITGSSPSDVQNTITQLLGSKAKTTFDGQQNEKTVLVYNDNQLVGWIGASEVPAPMGVQALAEHRISLVQKAA